MIPDDAVFQTIAGNLFEGLYIVDRDRIIRYWNKAAERITGFTAAEIVGRSCADNILTHVDGEGGNLCLSACPLSWTENPCMSLSRSEPRSFGTATMPTFC